MQLPRAQVGNLIGGDWTVLEDLRAFGAKTCSRRPATNVTMAVITRVGLRVAARMRETMPLSDQRRCKEAALPTS